MDITINLSEAEIHEAIRSLVAAKAPIQMTGNMDINIVAGRGSAGTSAVITFSDTAVKEEKAKVEKPIKVEKVTKDVTPPSPFDTYEGEKEEEAKEEGENIFGMPPEKSAAADLLFGNA